MGCYDTVEVPCPKCGEIEYFQSKSGACVLANYSLSTCPPDVLGDVNRHAPYDCQKCGTLFKVEAYTLAKSVVHVPREDA